jgi:hypothetical protein
MSDDPDHLAEAVNATHVVVNYGLPELAERVAAILDFLHEDGDAPDTRFALDAIYGFEDFLADLNAAARAGAWARAHPAEAVNLNLTHGFMDFVGLVLTLAHAIEQADRDLGIGETHH